MPLPDADLVVLVDTASIARLGPIGAEHGAWLAARPMVLVDHHATNDAGASLNLVDTGAASTCELLARLFDAMGWALDADAATALLLGVVSDTQSFQTSATRPASLRAAADLIDRGASHQQVVTALHLSLPGATAALVGQALARMQCVDGGRGWWSPRQCSRRRRRILMPDTRYCWCCSDSRACGRVRCSANMRRLRHG